LGLAEKWYGAKVSRHARERTQWVAAAQQGAESARERMVAMLGGGRESAYWRAVAANLLWRWAGRPEVQTALLARLRDEHPLVREKVVRALESAVGSGNPEVVTALEKSLTGDPVRSVRVAAAWALRARLDLQSRAGQELQQALSQEADQPAGQHRQAMLLLARGQTADALKHLETAVSWDPFSPPLRCETGMLLSRMGRTAEALDWLAQAERMAPADAQILYGRAVVLSRSGRLDEARSAAERALAVLPDF
jgi:Flp pilus assembly protein TadD